MLELNLTAEYVEMNGSVGAVDVRLGGELLFTLPADRHWTAVGGPIPASGAVVQPYIVEHMQNQVARETVVRWTTGVYETMQRLSGA